MTKYIKFLLVSLFFIGLASCASQLDDQLENPNTITPSKLDANLLLNKVMIGYADFFASASLPTMDLVRMTALTTGQNYEKAHQPQFHDALWGDAYQGVLVQADELLKSVAGKGLDHHEGITKTLKAYTLMTLVDIFGDVPYTEAIKGTETQFNPKADKGADIYKAAIAMLDEAIVSFGKTPVSAVVAANDIYYGGSAKKWAALARTLKLRAYMNTSLVDAATAKAAITTLLGEDIIDAADESFTYKYGTAATPTKSRPSWYRTMYGPTAGLAGGYLSNYFLSHAYNIKGVEDPRWRYYFYRQVGSLDKALDTDAKSIPCLVTPKPNHFKPTDPFCAFEPGFYGRDHGDNSGTPPDGKALTCVGVYPFGGRVDLNNGLATYEVVTQDGQGAKGAGIEPIWQHFFTDFVKAEAYQRLGIAGDAKAALTAGITKSIQAVHAFGAAKSQVVPAALIASTDEYIGAVESLFEPAAADKMNVIGKEYLLALYGNGVEAYNLYRRTGKPNDMSPILAVTSGNYVRSFIYPAVFVNLNSSTPQKVAGGVNKVFWDTNPDNFIN